MFETGRGEVIIKDVGRVIDESDLSAVARGRCL